MHRARCFLALSLGIASFHCGGACGDWRRPRCLDGGRWWPRRIKIEVCNENDVALSGQPVAIGEGRSQPSARSHNGSHGRHRIFSSRGASTHYSMLPCIKTANPEAVTCSAAGGVLAELQARQRLSHIVANADYLRDSERLEHFDDGVVRRDNKPQCAAAILDLLARQNNRADGVRRQDVLAAEVKYQIGRECE